MNKSLATLLLFFTAAHCFAQDIITKRNGEEIKAKVLEINVTDVKYKRFDNLNGPVFIESKSNFVMIRYENGTQTNFNDQPKLSKVSEKKSFFSAGYGVLSMSNSALVGDLHPEAKLASIPLLIYLKYALKTNEGFSLGVNYAYTYQDFYSQKFMTYSVLLRLNWYSQRRHGISEKSWFETYGGFGLGYRYYHLEIISTYPGSSNQILSTYYRNDGHENNEIPVGIEITYGIKYLFNDHLGAYSEIGLAKSFFQFGVVYNI